MSDSETRIEEALRAFVAAEEARAEREVQLPQDFADRVMEQVRQRDTKSDARKRTRSESIWNHYRSSQVWAIRAVAVAAVVFVTSGLWLLPGGEMTAIEEQRGTGSIQLPPKARFTPAAARLDLYDGKVRLSGAGSALPLLSAPGVNAFTNNLHGTDSTGLEVWLRGTVWVTNRPGVSTPKRPRDVAGVFVVGSLEPVGKAPEHVSQGYVR